MLLVRMDQLNLGVVLGDGRDDWSGLTGGVIVEANEQIVKPLIEVMVNELCYVGSFIGGNGDHITGVDFNVVWFK